MKCLDVFGMNEVASTFVFCQRMVISSREPNGTAEVLTVESTGAQLVPVVYWELCWFFTANLLGRRRMDTPSYRACGLATRNDKTRRTHCFAVPQEVKGSNWWPWDTMSLEFDFLVMTKWPSCSCLKSFHFSNWPTNHTLEDCITEGASLATRISSRRLQPSETGSLSWGRPGSYCFEPSIFSSGDGDHFQVGLAWSG